MRWTRGLLFGGLMSFAMGQTILFAVLGPVARQVGLAEWQVGVVIAASAFTVVLVSPIWGRWSDQWGRRRVILVGLLAYGAATSVFAGLLAAGMAGAIGATSLFAALVAARVLFALTTAGIQPSAVALMADLTDNAGRSAGVALVGAAFGIGTVLGPALAAALVGLGVLVPLFAVAGAALLVALLGAFRLANPPRPPHSATADAAPAAAVPPAVRPALGLVFLLYLAQATLQQTAAFYIMDFTGTTGAAGARLAGQAFVALALAMLLVQGGLVQSLKPLPRRMVALGLPIAATGLLGLIFAPSFPFLLMAFAVLGIGFGLAQPGITALVSLASGSAVQGRAAGLVQSAMAAGFVVGPLAGTGLYGIAHRAPFWLALGALALCAFLFTIVRTPGTAPLPVPAEP